MDVVIFVGVLCGICGDMWYVMWDMWMEKFLWEKGFKIYIDLIIYIFFYLFLICYDKMFLYWCVIKCYIFCKIGDEIRRGRRGEEEKR